MDPGSSTFMDRITIPERVLLHLLDHFQLSEEFTRPVQLTQEGIAFCVDVKRSHVSFCLKQLGEQGLITEKLSHIETKRRRMKAYSLTHEGFTNAVSLRKGLMDVEIQVRTGDEYQKYTIAVLLASNKKKITLVKILACIKKCGFVDISKIRSQSNKEKSEEQNIFLIENILPCPDFTGRTKEKEELASWLASEGGRICVIHGIAGIGKTSLGYEFSTEVRKTRHLFWYSCESWTNPRSVITFLAEFLKKLEKPELSLYLKGSYELDLSYAYRMMKEGFQGIKIFLVLDDIHKLHEKQIGICQIFAKLASTVNDIKLLILSRKIPKFYDRKEVLVRKSIKEMHLRGLELNDCTSLFARWSLLDSDSCQADGDEIYQITGGHPLTIELMKGGRYGKDVGRDISRFFTEEVLKDLSSDQQRMLDLAAFYRAEIPSMGLFLEEGDYQTLDSLLERSLIKETEEGYLIHDVLSEVIRKRISPHRKKEIHRIIGLHLLEESRIGDLHFALESFNHYMEAGSVHEAVNVIINFGTSLYGEGYIHDVLESIDRILKSANEIKSELPEDVFLSLKCLKGNLLTFTGRLEDARKLLDEVVGSKMDSGETDLVHAKARNGIGIIEYRSSNYKIALDQYNRAAEIAGKCNDRKYMVKVLSNLGVLYADIGKTEQARNAHLEAMAACWELDDREGVARAYNNLGIISFNSEDYQDAVTMFKKGLDISARLGKSHISAIAYNNLGEAYQCLGDEKMAVVYYRKGLEISEKNEFTAEKSTALKALSALSLDATVQKC